MKRRSLLTAFGGMFVASFPQPSQAIPDDMRKSVRRPATLDQIVGSPEKIALPMDVDLEDESHPEASYEGILSREQYAELQRLADRAVTQAEEELGPGATKQQLVNRAFEIVKNIS